MKNIINNIGREQFIDDGELGPDLETKLVI